MFACVVLLVIFYSFLSLFFLPFLSAEAGGGGQVQVGAAQTGAHAAGRAARVKYAFD